MSFSSVFLMHLHYLMVCWNSAEVLTAEENVRMTNLKLSLWYPSVHCYFHLDLAAPIWNTHNQSDHSLSQNIRQFSFDHWGNRRKYDLDLGQATEQFFVELFYHSHTLGGVRFIKEFDPIKLKLLLGVFIERFLPTDKFVLFEKDKLLPVSGILAGNPCLQRLLLLCVLHTGISGVLNTLVELANWCKWFVSCLRWSVFCTFPLASSTSSGYGLFLVSKFSILLRCFCPVSGEKLVVFLFSWFKLCDRSVWALFADSAEVLVTIFFIFWVCSFILPCCQIKDLIEWSIPS